MAIYPCLYGFAVDSVDDRRFSRENEPVVWRFTSEDVFYIVRREVHLMLPSFDKHVEFRGEVINVLLRSIQYYFVPSCHYFKVRIIAAQSFQYPVSGPEDFYRVYSFESQCLSCPVFVHIMSFHCLGPVYRSFLLLCHMSAPSFCIHTAFSTVRIWRDIPLPESCSAYL